MTRLLLFGCLALALSPTIVAREVAALDWPEKVSWTSLFEGVEYLEVRLAKPRPLAVHALRVDLSTAGVQPVTDSDNGDRPEETDGLKTSTFLTQTGCQVAINGAPFWPGVKEEGQPQNVVGLVVMNGELVSPVDEDKPRAALVFRRDGKATIESPPITLDEISSAVGGYGVVLRKDQVVRPSRERDDFIDNLHPRTAVGVANSGRTLVLLVVDGRQPGYSEGVSLSELAKLLQRIGAQDGLNLDGGGTTTMVVADANGGFRLLNRPIDGGKPGKERISASHLGIRALPAKR